MTIPSNEPNSAYLRLTNWLVFGLFCLIGLALLLCVQLVITSYILNSRETARQNRCLFNLSMQMRGVLAYCALHNDQFPPSVNPIDSVNLSAKKSTAVQSEGKTGSADSNASASAFDFSWRVWAAEFAMADQTSGNNSELKESSGPKPDSNLLSAILSGPSSTSSTENIKKYLSESDKYQLFICPDSYKQNIGGKFTSYMYVTGPNCISDGLNSVNIRQLSRGAAYVLTITEVINSKTVWYAPFDLSHSQFDKGSNLPTGELCAGSFHAPKTERKVNVAFADGHATALRTDIDREIWQLLPTVSAPEAEAATETANDGGKTSLSVKENAGE